MSEKVRTVYVLNRIWSVCILMFKASFILWFYFEDNKTQDMIAVK